MNHFEISLADYQRALVETTDQGYLRHLQQDFVITVDGRVLPRITFAEPKNQPLTSRIK